NSHRRPPTSSTDASQRGRLRATPALAHELRLWRPPPLLIWAYRPGRKRDPGEPRSEGFWFPSNSPVGRFRRGSVPVTHAYPYQNVEKGVQLCSRFAQGLDVPKKVHLNPSLAAASLASLFEHPASENSP